MFVVFVLQFKLIKQSLLFRFKNLTEFLYFLVKTHSLPAEKQLKFFVRCNQGSRTLFGNGAGAHGIGKISGVLTKIKKFDIVLLYNVSIARLIPITKLL